MTIINPKSISGITSITTASGADNLLTVHTNNTTERIRINNDGDVIVGSGITVSPDGDIFATGVTTSTTFVGALTGNVTGNVSGSSGSATGNAGGLTGTPNISCGTIAGSTGTFSGAVSGTTGTFTGDVDIADKIVHTGDTNTAIRFPDADTITAETSGAERLRINSQGKVLVNTTTASSAGNSQYSRLEVSGNSSSSTGAGHFGIKAGTAAASLSDGDTLGRLIFSGLDGGDFAYIQASVDGSPSGSDFPGRIMFHTCADGASSSTERLRIASNGDVGVGKNNPDVTLHVGGGAVTNPQIKLHRTSTYDNAWRFFQSHYDADSYGSLFIQPTLATTPNVEITNSSGAMAMRVDSDTGVISVKSGGGIDFSATSDAGGMSSELLDDYEEGTFTPSYDGGGGVTFSYSQRYGYYTKVGDTVFFSIYIQGYASTITGGNQNNGVALQGLPFTIKNLTRYYPAFTIGRTYKWDIDSDKRIYSYGTPNTTTGRFIIESDDNTGSILVASQLNANTTELFLNGHYKV